MRPSRLTGAVSVLAVSLALGTSALAQAPAAKPNILVIMGDDVGWFNIGAYHQGIMSGKTPNLDKLAAAGMRFTDSHSPAAVCTPTRYAIMTGQYAWRHPPG